MSVSKWAYSPAKCDGEPCVGECDMCSKAYGTEETRRKLMKSCPRCKSAGQIIMVPALESDRMFYFRIECKECGFSTFLHDSVSEALETWNGGVVL